MTTTTAPPALYLQQRVALFGKACTGVALFSLLLRVITIMLLSTPVELREPAFAWHLVGVVAVAAVWLTCSRGIRSTTFVRIAETLGLATSSAAFAMMSRALSEKLRHPPELGDASGPVRVMVERMVHQHTSLIAVFGLVMFLALRAALVPSTARRTLALGIMMGLVTLVALEYPLGEARPLRAAVGTVAYWSMSTALCVVISKVIHGLRREAQHAKRLGRYTLEAKLGEGGMGVVYRAKHAMLRRPTAIKLLHSDRCGATGLARFENEVQLTAQLTHPNTVTVFDYGRTPDGVFYYAMELLDGGTLEQIVTVDGPQTAARVVAVMKMVCGALAEAHELGLIHRDIKPANIVLAKRGGQYDIAKVVDFGLVKDIETEGAVVTQESVITGTPMYMAPEALKAPNSVDARADIYALGAVAYYMLTGDQVFAGASAVEVFSHHLHTVPDLPSTRMSVPLDAGLEQIVMRCLAKAPESRPASAAELAAELNELSVDPWTQRDAIEWWREHGDAIEALKGAAASSDDRAAMAVDISART